MGGALVVCLITSVWRTVAGPDDPVLWALALAGLATTCFAAASSVKDRGGHPAWWLAVSAAVYVAWYAVSPL
jgi:hypothetical protein